MTLYNFLIRIYLQFCFFFFQAEDGIRDVAVTGVQTCALPIWKLTGNLVNFLRGESKRIGAEEVSKRYVYLTAGSCGACRFGQYHQSYELAQIGRASCRERV